MVFLENKQAYLLDYKTGAVNAKYSQQIQEYQDAIEDLGYTVLKKLSFILGQKSK